MMPRASQMYERSLGAVSVAVTSPSLDVVEVASFSGRAILPPILGCEYNPNRLAG